jgi:thiosulfate/3-mercaptopyruvate sulfurtransferase
LIAEILVSRQWLAEHLDDPALVIVDTRPKVAYMYGHIPNSVSLVVDQLIKINEHGAHLAPEPQDASKLLGELGIDSTKTIIVTGESMDPSIARIAWTLMYLGHSNTKILDIGIGTWQSLGLAITRAQKKPTPVQFVPKINSQIRIEASELQTLGNAIILDARTPQEYFGGHIPNSILLPFTDGIGQEGTIFDKKESLQDLFAQKQIQADKQTICYCTHGHRASSLFFQLKIAGFENVKLYDGSFIDWYSKRLALE